jgi:hypothetical protein
MKSLCRYMLTLTVLTMLVSCGKDNKSGGSSYNYGYNNGTYSPLTSGSGVAYGSFNLDYVLSQTYCTTTGAPNQNRMAVQFALTGYPTSLAAGDIYVGVTTAGDVAVLIGQANTAPLFRAFICQRYNVTNGQGQLMDLAVGTATRCNVKPLVRATLYIPGLTQPLYFRQLDGGRLNYQTGQLVPYTQPVCNY